jgi:hypothetical protein
VNGAYSSRMRRLLLWCEMVLVASGCLTACAGPRLTPALSPGSPHRDALLILPGFGYARVAGQPFRVVRETAAASGIDVYVPAYVTRSGLEANRAALRAFIREQHLDRYERVHVFAFIAGAWTVNPLIDAGALPNLATIVYDRSPFQERAPSIAVRDMRVPAWLRYGSTIFDVARTPYPPLARPGVRVALLVETKPTAFIEHHAKDGDTPPSDAFSCTAMRQRFDACAYTAMSHDELYTRFTEIWPSIESFMRTGEWQ